MEFHCLPMLFFLNLILMTVHAALPPHVYWERMLPNTPMPKAMIDLLNLGSKETHSQDESPYIFSGKRTLCQYDDGTKKIKTDNEWLNKNSDDIKKTRKDNEWLNLYSDGTKKIQKDNGWLNLYSDGTKNTQKDNEWLNLYSDGTKKIQKDNGWLNLYSDGTKKTQKDNEWLNLYSDDTKRTQKDSEWLNLYSDGTKKTQKDNALLNIHGYKQNQKEDEKDSESYNDANHHQHDNPKADLIFFEEGLRPGTKLDAHFHKRKNGTPLLPRQIAERIPFSSEKIKEILEMLLLKPESENAENVETAISLCEAPVMNGEEKHCATSLESMVDFITSKLGKNVHVVSTEEEKETKSRKFTVKDGVKMLAEDKAIACHPMNYPYVVFYCHEKLNTTAHFVPLEGEDGARVKAVAVCHKDTSEWDPEHVVLQVLKVKPGTAPVCHFLPEGHLLWFVK